MCEQDGLMRAQRLFVKQAEGTNAGQGLCSMIIDQVKAQDELHSQKGVDQNQSPLVYFVLLDSSIAILVLSTCWKYRLYIKMHKHTVSSPTDF